MLCMYVEILSVCLLLPIPYVMYFWWTIIQKKTTCDYRKGCVFILQLRLVKPVAHTNEFNIGDKDGILKDKHHTYMDS